MTASDAGRARPILFSAPMVRALLVGRKTQTRRVISTINSYFGSASNEYWDHCELDKAWPDTGLGAGGYLHVPCHVNEFPDGRMTGADCELCRDFFGGPAWAGTVHRLYPRWRIGDRLWVREALSAKNMDLGGALGLTDPVKALDMTRGDVAASYAVDGEFCVEERGFNLAWTWKRPTLSAVFMPRAFSRLTLLVTAVRVQRVGEIDEADIIAEGVDPLDSDLVAYRGRFEGGGCVSSIEQRSRKRAFTALWDAQHGDGAFDANPWIAALTFTVEHRNIDAAAGHAGVLDDDRGRG